MRSDHNGIKEMLPEYLNGSLTEEFRCDIETHLKECRECRDELSLITEFIYINVPDPGELFWRTLPLKVRGAVEREKAGRFSLKSLFRRLPLPVAAAAALLLILILSYVKKEEQTPELALFFEDPFTAEVMDYSGITEKDIPLTIDRVTDNTMYLQPEDFEEYSYYREFASLSSKEMESLYEALKTDNVSPQRTQRL
ncbi:MAG TPA: zf-HC2 domain-containing protein [Nitrospirae bacterium]|nr:hypothetical protein BMS3Abin08_00376 [bacterium BMS3Abin08]HDY71792.1 zf-HC2 domain-containing protein [Nitrospirota bacterium]